MPFRPLPPQLDLPALDQRVLERWRATDVFARSLEQTRDGEPYVVYEGPPTANGRPGTHHVEARVFKDLWPRYQTMQGRHVPRRAGWDCHGLPVELAVEKELGFTGKADIEAYGIAEFNARCKESVLRHVAEFERMTERMGYWVDFADAYSTMDTSYIESVWWSLATIFDKGLLVEDHRVAPYCPRCQTGLSDHEVAQGYTELTDPSVYVRMPLTSGPLAGQADLLVWTTTPWTLPSNTAVAVHPQVTYVVVEVPDGAPVLVAEPLVEHAVPGGEVTGQSFRGSDMERWTYEKPFALVSGIDQAHYVCLADYVTVDSGTGLVHQAPAFGAEDLAVARAYDLPVVNPVGKDGRFTDDIPLVGGQFFKDADPVLVEDLWARGVLLRHEPYTHQYPLCWRCDTALLYYALPSWYIRTTAVKDQLLEQNSTTAWHPATIRDGRFGEWLRGNVDWALSRNRYWGTPLPIWRCTADDTHLDRITSIAELAQRSGQELSALDPHRPFVDDVTMPCSHCGAESRRVPEVIDCWYDSGAMPFAQIGYPHAEGSEALLGTTYPADFICEALDQTRGWFYTLLAVGTLAFEKSSYERVLCLGIILDEDGRKMSKHLGNVLDPFELMDRQGADPLRWLMLAQGNPWGPRRIGHEAVADVTRTVLATYWNTVSFHALYAHASAWDPLTTPAPPVAERHVLDRWALSELHAVVAEVTAGLDTYDPVRSGRRLTAFVDDLSNWYVRRSRRRFWAGDPGALATLHECLHVLTLLMAPFVPFITEEVWSEVVRAGWPDLPDSVHLAPWPQVDGSLVDDDLTQGMATVRRLVELGRAARAQSSVKTRQPLGRALVSGGALSDELLAEIAEELNVVVVEPLGAAGSELVDVVVKPNFRLLGKRFGERTKEVAAQVSAATYSDGVCTVTLDGETVTLTGEELLVTETPREGWAVAAGEGLSVALDLELTDALVDAGLVREAVRLVQQGRKDAGLDVSDRIELWLEATGPMQRALSPEGTGRLADEVLAVAVTSGHPGADLTGRGDAELGLRFWLRAAGA